MDRAIEKILEAAQKHSMVATLCQEAVDQIQQGNYRTALALLQMADNGCSLPVWNAKNALIEEMARACDEAHNAAAIEGRRKPGQALVRVPN